MRVTVSNRERERNSEDGGRETVSADKEGRRDGEETDTDCMHVQNITYFV